MPLGTSIPARLRESDGTVYYVDKDHGSASDANAGTSESLPWLTYGAAFRATGSGGPANNGIVKVKKGATPYVENVTVSRANGSAANLVTVEAFNPADPAVIQGRTLITGSYWRIRNLISDFSGSTSGSLFGVDGGSNVEFYGCTARNAGAGTQGFQPKNLASNIWFVNCLAHNNGDGADNLDHGWYIQGGSAIYLLNCISYGNAAYGYQIYSTSNNLENINFYNCVSDDTGKGTFAGARSGYLCEGDHADGNANTTRNVHYYNCLSTFHTAGSPTQYGWRFDYNISRTNVLAWSGGWPMNSLESCLVFGSDGTRQFSADHATDKPNEADMVTVTNFLNQDPLYVNRAARDYKLQAGSPCIQAGLEAYTPTFDFDGVTRVHADIGAYGYTADDSPAQTFRLAPMAGSF